MKPKSSNQAVSTQTTQFHAGMDTYFDLVDLRLFTNIAETECLTRGAEHSYVSVPAASVRIKHIEERLGVKLLFRTHQGVSLTPAGELFLHHCRLLLRQLEHLWGDMQGYAKWVKGHLRIFANTTAISEFLPSVLSEYLSTHPGVNVDLREHLSPYIVDAVREGATDIGIAAGNINTEGLETFSYKRDRLVLVTPLVHPLSQHQSIPFDASLEFDYVSLAQASAINGFLALPTEGRPFRVRLQVSNFEVLFRMVERNVGVSVIPESVARRHVKTNAIRIIPLSDDWAERDLQICVRDFKLLPAFARELIDLLVSDRIPDRISR
jgi:DNA-binding transcriptional LysR family regulator